MQSFLCNCMGISSCLRRGTNALADLEETRFVAKKLSAWDVAAGVGGGRERRKKGGAATAVSPCLLLFIRLLSRLRQQAAVHPSSISPRPGLMSITRGKILHYCHSESVAVTLAHVTQSLMH